MVVLRPCGRAARSELQVACGLAARSDWLCGGVEAVRESCPLPAAFGGFVEVLRPCGQAARSELEALWRC